MEISNLKTIKKEVFVEASQETAFQVFTQKMDEWWPKTHHVGKTPMVKSILEPKNGGLWYSVHEDGSIANIGYVLSWNPNSQLILAWQIDGNYQYDPQLVLEVEVNFVPVDSKITRVSLEHRDLEKLIGGEKAIESMDQGWGMIINLYKKVCDPS